MPRGSMRRTPAVTLAAIVSLALGIGANTAIFTLMDAVLLRTLPVSNPGELYFLAHGDGEQPEHQLQLPAIRALRAARRSVCRRHRVQHHGLQGAGG